MNPTLKRTITALIFLFIAIAAVWSGLQHFIYLTHVLVLFIQIETAKLLFKKHPKIIVPFIFQSFISTLIFNYAPFYFLPTLFIFISLSICLLLVSHSQLENAELFNVISTYILGFCYVGILPSLTTKLMMLYNGFLWFLICLGVVFSGDVVAYFVGRKWGQKKLMPTISPNKTWAGSMGGLAASVVFGTALGKYLIPETSLAPLIIACALAGVMAQSGDFFESLIKRTAGSKDSGSLLPGHGGFLDRFDGVLFALPVFYYIAI